MVYGMGPYAVIDCNLTLCRRQSRLQHIYHGQSQPNARVDLNPVPRSTLSASQGLRILPQGQTKKGRFHMKQTKTFGFIQILIRAHYFFYKEDPQHRRVTPFAVLY